jgi:hypothetical protein
VVARLAGEDAAPPKAPSITQAVSDGHGGWYVAGAFTKLAGVREDSAAHILANGTVDRRWRARTTPLAVAALAATRETVYMAITSSTGSASDGAPPAGPSGYSPTRLVAFSARTGAAEAAPGNPRYPIITMAAIGNRLLIGQGAGSGPHVPSCLLAYDTTTRRAVPGFHAEIHLAAGDEGNPCIGALLIRGEQLYVGGAFDHVDGTARASLARLDLETGALDLGWRPAHPVDLGTTEIAVGDGLVITNVGNGALGAVSAKTGAIDRHWVWPPRHDAPGTGLNCCAATRTVIHDQLLIAADSPEFLAAIDLATETLVRYPHNTIVAEPVTVATPSRGEILAGFGYG